MKLAFLGSGNMAVGLGKRLANRGHELTFAFGRDVAKLTAQAKLVSDRAEVRTPSEAGQWADVVILTVPFHAATAALQSAGNLRGKVVWSIVNPLKPDFSGLEVGTTTSGAEELAKLVPGARFVAALPPFAEVLNLSDPLPLKPSVFVCGQDDEAKAIVHGLLSEVGADPADGGELFAARFFEPALMGLVYLAYGRGLSGKIGLHFIRSPKPGEPMATTLSTAQMKERVRFEDFVNNRKAEVLHQNMTADFYDHDGPGNVPTDVKGDEEKMLGMYKLMPDLHLTIEDMIAEGDRVMCRNIWRWTDPRTGTPMEFHGFVLWRFEGDKIAERWATVTRPQEDHGTLWRKQ